MEPIILDTNHNNTIPNNSINNINYYQKYYHINNKTITNAGMPTILCTKEH